MRESEGEGGRRERESGIKEATRETKRKKGWYGKNTQRQRLIVVKRSRKNRERERELKTEKGRECTKNRKTMLTYICHLEFLRMLAMMQSEDTSFSRRFCEHLTAHCEL